MISDLVLCGSVTFSGLCGSELCYIFVFDVAEESLEADGKSGFSDFQYDLEVA